MYKNFLPFLIAVVLAGCAVSQNEQPVSKENNQTVEEEIPPKDTDAFVLYLFEKEITQKLNIDHNGSKSDILDINQTMVLTKTDHYIKVLLRESVLFENASTIPKHEAVQYVKPLIRLLSVYPDVVIQVISHTNTQEEKKHSRIFTDKRAINVANLFLYEKVKNKVYAKGCADQQPLLENAKELNKRVEIYFYPNETYVNNPCQ